VPTLAGALVAAVLLPRLLQAFCEFELGLGAAFVVTFGRHLAQPVRRISPCGLGRPGSKLGRRPA
jgi:hypothetical protein